jgi:hypothetical protein
MPEKAVRPGWKGIKGESRFRKRGQPELPLSPLRGGRGKRGDYKNLSIY